MFVESKNTFKLISEDKILDLKIQTWCVKELYLSPHRVLLNNLSREKFMIKFQKAEKYIKKQNNLREFINYFIVCVRSGLEVGEC